MKKCTVCFKEKGINEFQKDKSKKDGYRPDCKNCRKGYYEANKDKIKRKSKEEYTKYNKEYYKKNKNRILEEKKEYWVDKKEQIDKYVADNRCYINNRKNNYVKNRRSVDPLFKLISNIRSLIGGSFKNGFSKNTKTVDILGCSFDSFKNYIESKFEDGMNWENHGQSSSERRWQLDHIIPISLAVDEYEIIKLNHYSNFQPMWESENKSKGNRVKGDEYHLL
jgi:hypothetical protein